ncbi:MAG: glycosyltransferase family 1 protein [bacterium]
MRIGIDARPLSVKYPAGISMFVRNWLNNLRLTSDNTFILYSNKPVISENNSKDIIVRSGSGRLPGSIWIHSVLPKLILKDKLDVFWGSLNTLPWNLPASVRSVVTIYDLVAYKCPETMSFSNRLINKILLPHAVNKADAVVAISQSTANDIVEVFPGAKKKIRVVYGGIDPSIKRIDKKIAYDKLRSCLKIEFPFLLTVGSFEPRKNLSTVYKAFSHIKDKIPHHLVCVGPSGWKLKQLKKEFIKGPLKDRIHLIGYLDDEMMPYVYSSAEVFLFPSLYEGFGLPVLEAMTCGTPVVVSDAASLPEVAGEAAPAIKPDDYRSLAELIMKFYNDKIFRDRCVEKGFLQTDKFNWRKSAEQLGKILQES